MHLTKEYLSEFLEFNYSTGELLWKTELPRKYYKTHAGWVSATKQKAGRIATTNGRHGALYVNLFSKFIKASHIVAVLSGINHSDIVRIQHKDGDNKNINWHNLRIIRKLCAAPENAVIDIEKTVGKTIKVSGSFSYECKDEYDVIEINEKIRKALGL